MFDIGFWELALIGVIALLVVGPERLPKLARTAGLWVGKARSVIQNVKSEIDRELAAEELKRTLAKQAGTEGVHEILENTTQSLKETEQLLAKDVAEPVTPAGESNSGDAAGNTSRNADT